MQNLNGIKSVNIDLNNVVTMDIIHIFIVFVEMFIKLHTLLLSYKINRMTAVKATGQT